VLVDSVRTKSPKLIQLAAMLRRALRAFGEPRQREPDHQGLGNVLIHLHRVGVAKMDRPVRVSRVRWGFSTSTS